MTISYISPKTKIYTAKPKNFDDECRSFKAGYIIANDAPQKTVADGLKVRSKDLSWYFLIYFVTDILMAAEVSASSLPVTI